MPEYCVAEKSLTAADRGVAIRGLFLAAGFAQEGNGRQARGDIGARWRLWTRCGPNTTICAERWSGS